MFALSRREWRAISPSRFFGRLTVTPLVKTRTFASVFRQPVFRAINVTSTAMSNAVSPRLFYRAVFLLVAFAFAAVGRAAEPGSAPFIERVQPADYYGVEKIFQEPFSQTHELVVLRTTAGTPASVLAIKRGFGGEGYALTVHLASSDAPDGWLKINEELDASTGQQVLRAFELKLHRQVALSAFKRLVSKTDTDIWVHQRLADNKVAAAVIKMEATLGNPEASTFLDEFVGSLQLLIGKEGQERAALLQKIDRLATQIIMVETP